MAKKKTTKTKPKSATKRVAARAAKRASGNGSGTSQARARAKTVAQQSEFLEHYSSLGVITAAAKLTGISRTYHYRWMSDEEKWPEYPERFLDAYEMATDRLEAAAVQRAIGWNEDIVGRDGKVTGSRHVYSDRMMELLLKARRPQIYRERFELTGDVAPAQSYHVHLYIPDNGRSRELKAAPEPILVEAIED